MPLDQRTLARIECHIADLRVLAARTACEIGRKCSDNATVTTLPRTAIREAYLLGRAVERAIARRAAEEAVIREQKVFEVGFAPAKSEPVTVPDADLPRTKSEPAKLVDADLKSEESTVELADLKSEPVTVPDANLRLPAVAASVLAGAPLPDRRSVAVGFLLARRAFERRRRVRAWW
jgi:hypothetical protein